MDEQEARETLRRYRQALEGRRVDSGVPNVPSFRGTMLINADGTQYHYAGEWCRADDVEQALSRLREFVEAEKSLDGLAPLTGYEIGGDTRLYVEVKAVAALLVARQGVTPPG
jgi:hypothetical protein